MIPVWQSAKTPPWGLPFVSEYWDGSYGITLATGVSQWSPIKGTHNFTQGTANAQPSYSGGVLTFDGLNDDLGFTFAVSQPYTVIFIGQQTSWMANKGIIGDTSSNNTPLFQSNTGVSPRVAMFAGTSVVAHNDNFVVGTDAVVCSVVNGASSSIQVNLTTATTGDPGAGGLSGITIGSSASRAAFAAIKARGFAYCNTALTAQQYQQFYYAAKARYGI